ncbi:DUF1203 domain-containing protein [Epilithonimonas sp. JDS]|uniref:DUF1203 domain-containing protein n=1 Tax=Epilithonimonas sp. JDS TaxID=2902797 RepID=UPI001E39E845|nr:DUF1203 domain-containing protein [Epilithonimonas sp. JDS]MCD9853338.1 DUF1203 domain-containing protein [Epilithonimonas sp. JDS]
MNNFKFVALSHLEFAHLNDLSKDELLRKNIVLMTVDKFPGFPCRVTLEDAEIGEEVFLMSYNYHSATSPYQSSGPVFIRKNKVSEDYQVNVIPRMFTQRLLSLRAYDKKGMMIKADVFEGNFLKDKIQEFFNNEKIDYLHIHNAKPGCFNCLVKKVEDGAK